MEGDGPGLRRRLPLEVFMGMRSWRCWRETEIWRAMETFASVLRRAWVSSSDFWESMDGRGCEWVAEGEGEMAVVRERMGSGWRVGESIVSAFCLGERLGMIVVVVVLKRESACAGREVDAARARAWA